VRRDEREALEVEALLTDRYLESLFASLDRHGTDAPADTDLAADVRAAAAVLAADLGRVHPSFRFEERLAARLQELAIALRAGEVVPAAEVVPFSAARRRSTARRARRRVRASRAATLARFGGLHAPHVGLPSVDRQLPRQLMIGGALTSAALSVAGAYVAWRRGQTTDGPMARAVRAAHGRGAVERGLLTAARAARARSIRREA
jgi:hypothetical protein